MPTGVGFASYKCERSITCAALWGAAIDTSMNAACNQSFGQSISECINNTLTIFALSQDLDDVRGTTHRLERYVEQMLRQMLGSLNAGQH